MESTEATELLADAPWIRVAFVIDGQPSVLPVNHVLYEDAVFFRTAAGTKLATAAAAGAVALEADGGDAEQRIGWSVVAHGQASIVTDPELEQALWALPFEPWAVPDDRPFWVRVDVHTITGRRIVRP